MSVIMPLVVILVLGRHRSDPLKPGLEDLDPRSIPGRADVVRPNLGHRNRDAVGDRHRRPDPPAAVVGGDRGIERLQRLSAVKARMAAEPQWAESVLASDADRRQHVLDGPSQTKILPSRK